MQPGGRKRSVIAAVLSVLAAVLLAAPAAASSRLGGTRYEGPVPLPSTGALWGAYLSLDDHNGLDHNTAWTNFEAMVGRSMDVERVYYNWNDLWPTAEDAWSRDHGHTLYISWNAADDDGICTPFADIAAGLYDADIDVRAEALIAFGAPVIFTFNHEPMNPPPGGTLCGTSPEYVAAFRHVHDRFTADGATNVSYAMTLFALSYTHGRGDEFYAGDRYVDLIAADGYNWHGCSFHQGPWREFRDIFQDFYDYGLSKGKPMFVAEYGTGEDDQDPNGKAQWFTDAADQLKRWPEIKGVSYFNVGGGYPCARYVDSSPQSLSSFQAMGADPYFNAPVATSPVDVADFAFAPRTANVAPGLGVSWSFDGPSQHTVTDRTGLGLFDTGPTSPGDTFRFFFVGAGTYAYGCSIHPQMVGRIQVPVLAEPPEGTQSTEFTITWAADHAPTGFAFDVQIMRPGTSTWRDWLTLQTVNGSPFVPDAGPGTYRFRARYRAAGVNVAARWSNAATITVSA